jgi:hypothetical protein
VSSERIHRGDGLKLVVSKLGFAWFSKGISIVFDEYFLLLLMVFGALWKGIGRKTWASIVFELFSQTDGRMP